MVQSVYDPPGGGTAGTSATGEKHMSGLIATVLAEGVYIGGGVLLVILIILVVLVLMRRA